MKQLITTLIALLCLFISRGQPIVPSTPPHLKPISSVTIQLSIGKTTNLIFPSGIISVDRGSADILVQKANGVENILQLKASKAGFEETNLTVITKDGQLYSFLMVYNKTPKELNFKVIEYVPNSISNNHTSVDSVSTENGKTTTQTTAQAVLNLKRTSRWLSKKTNSMRLSLNGIYIQDAIMYLRFSLHNTSNIGYDAEAIKFTVQDLQRAKRTATQEIELQPLTAVGNSQKVLAKSTADFVLALPKYTLPDGKFLLVQVQEHAGGRHLDLKITNRLLMKAIPIP